MNSQNDHCLFRSGLKKFAFSTEIAKEVIERRAYTEIPRAPEGLLGAFNLRGEILPLLSLATFLHQQPASEDRPGNLIILADEDLRVAVGVDEVLAVQHFPPWEIHPATPEEIAIPLHLIRGVVRPGGSPTIVLDGSLFLREVAEIIRAGFMAIPTEEKSEQWPLQKS